MLQRHRPSLNTLVVALACGVLLIVVPVAASDRAADGLVFDARKIVSSQEDAGWKIDKYEIEDMMPDALLSVCRAPVTAQQAALAIVQERTRALGGPLIEALKRGAAIDEVPKLVGASRVEALLSEALRRRTRECPLGLRADPNFAGIQTGAHRFFISGEGGGLFVGQRSNGKNNVGGGGTGRLLLGYGLNYRRTLLMGLEFGGNALFERGSDEVNFPVQFTAAAPLVLRHHLLTFHHDLELAPIMHLTEADTRPSFGGRLGTTLGVSTMRIRRIMPWAGATLALEYAMANSYRAAVTAVKGGARVGFDWDF